MSYVFYGEGKSVNVVLTYVNDFLELSRDWYHECSDDESYPKKVEDHRESA